MSSLQRYTIGVVVLLLTLVLSCCQGRGKRIQDSDQAIPDREELIRANQMMVREDENRINEKAAQAGWTLSRTQTGEFYQIRDFASDKENKKTGKRGIRAGDEVSLTYTLRLLTGEEIGNSQQNGPKQFIIEGSGAESGMHSVMKRFSEGDSVLILLPPHRAYGLMGDGDKIPGRAILWYEIRIDSVTSTGNNG
ncbi:MAG: hypothetical protein GX098_05885 [Bacteroidales bacterium]|nr:hypothetical protein [Bacteroidales bacterium]